MRMANKTNVNANKEAETVEEVKAVDDAPVTEGTDVKVNEDETVPADKKGISVCWQSLRICASVTRRNPRRCMISEPRKC